jgi:hypothetical protein
MLPLNTIYNIEQTIDSDSENDYDDDGLINGNPSLEGTPRHLQRRKGVFKPFVRNLDKLPLSKKEKININDDGTIEVDGKTYIYEPNDVITPDAKCSRIYKTNDGKYVFKEILEMLGYNVFEREVYLLNYLNENNCKFVPELIHYDDDKKIIMMNNCGEVLDGVNTPGSFILQLEIIGKKLKQLNVKHNDIKIYDEILISKGRVYICDFGWGSIGDDHSCGIGLWNGKKPEGYSRFQFTPPFYPGEIYEHSEYRINTV